MKKRRFLFASLIFLFSLAALRLWGKEPESGRFLIYINGQLVGQEEFKIVSEGGDKLVSTSVTEMYGADEGNVQSKLAFESKLVIDARTLTPITYTYQFKGGRGDHYEVAFENGTAKRKLLAGGKVDIKSKAVEKEVMILDYNVYHHYQFLAAKYNQKQKGKQMFYNYVPLIADELEVSVDFNGDSTLTVKDKKIPIKSYTLDLAPGYSADLLVDQNGKVLKIFFQRHNVEVVREDLAKP